MTESAIDHTKRRLLKTLLFSSVLPITMSRAAVADTCQTPVRIIIPPNYRPQLDADMQYRLARATLHSLEEQYQGVTIPLWNKRFEDIDFEKRVVNILFWVARAIQQHQQIYPLDPAWVVAQIMAESLFYEFAISRALAVGVCQFIAPTALAYKMRVAGSQSAHHTASFRLPGYAGKAKEYYTLRRAKKQHRKTRTPENLLSLEDALHIITQEQTEVSKEIARQNLQYRQKLQEFDQGITAARQQYTTYLHTNIHDKDIFTHTDFFRAFDERFTYRKPIFAMVKMLAKFLRARSGNILAAAAGYNAGLSRTLDAGRYRAYGKIPAIGETATYVSRILVNHYEIVQRL